MSRDKCPCKEGDIFTLKDGTRAVVCMTHRPGNGYGVNYKIIGREYGPWPNHWEHYTPWYKFRKLIAEKDADTKHPDAEVEG